MTVLSCNCDAERACLMHADDLYDDGVENERDYRIIDQMASEARDNPDFARALLTLYPDDAFTQNDLDAMRKADARDCACNGCANDGKWFNQ